MCMYMTVKIFSNTSTVHISENVQNKIYNLQIRLEHFADEKKSFKKILFSWNLTFITGNTKSPQT